MMLNKKLLYIWFSRTKLNWFLCFFYCNMIWILHLGLPLQGRNACSQCILSVRIYPTNNCFLLQKVELLSKLSVQRAATWFQMLHALILVVFLSFASLNTIRRTCKAVRITTTLFDHAYSIGIALTARTASWMKMLLAPTCLQISFQRTYVCFLDFQRRLQDVKSPETSLDLSCSAAAL